MRKYENVDVIAALGAVMEANTEHYKTDFQYDIEMFQKAAAAPDGDINRLLWLSRPSGTECFYERDAYMKESYANHAWLYYADTQDPIRAYAVEITGAEGDKVIGNLYELDYKKHTAQLGKDTLNAAEITLRFENGTEGRYSYDDYDGRKQRLQMANGKIVYSRLEPKNKDALQQRLRMARNERQKYTPAVFKLQNSSRKPSIRAQLSESKASAAPKKTAAKEKSNKVEVSL